MSCAWRTGSCLSGRSTGPRLGRTQARARAGGGGRASGGGDLCGAHRAGAPFDTRPRSTSCSAARISILCCCCFAASVCAAAGAGLGRAPARPRGRAAACAHGPAVQPGRGDRRPSSSRSSPILLLQLRRRAWFSDRVSTALSESLVVAEAYLHEHQQALRADVARHGERSQARCGDPQHRSAARLDRSSSAQAALRSSDRGGGLRRRRAHPRAHRS